LKISSQTRRWEAVTAESPLETTDINAAELVFERVVDDQLAVLDGSYRCPYLRVVNPQALAEWLGWTPSDLRSHPTTFDDDGGDLIAPWSTARAVAERAAEISPTRILDYVDKEERGAAQEAIHGHGFASSRGSKGFIEPDQCIEYDKEHNRPVRNLLRTWCGTAAVTEREELNVLQQEIRRVGEVAEEAIKALRAAGSARDADRLDAKLDSPVEELRLCR
jgi:hypothetical protein